MEKSKCCNAAVTTIYGGENGTSYCLCKECNRGCDINNED